MMLLVAQSTFEPSDQYGVGYLEALRSSLVKHGQYRYTGETGLWRKLSPESGSESTVREMTTCHSMASKVD
jgi:hypothetical protein